MIYIGIALAVLLVLIIIMYNMMISKKNKLKKAYASLDVMLKKRYDLIPNLVDTVKAYKSYEGETLEKIISLRSRANECKDTKDLENVSNEFNNFRSEINMLAEGYPDLKASTNFMHLQKALNEIEEQISAARRTYNAHVENFNTFISIIPVNIFATLFGFKKYNFFEINDNERNLKIDF